LVFMYTINQERILPDFLNFGTPFNFSLFIHSNYTNYTHTQIYSVDNHQTYFAENVQSMIFQQYLLTLLGVTFVKILIFILGCCIPIPLQPKDTSH
jgi:hypothetical protein